ncbi:ABC transporter permease [Spirillospora albida]|uniref:ABC transporter permease n=1 Tax=Spirillospora albida TaxID=58123 RepID=UPI0004C012E8|nr:ABC transporter permease [Spirillospora albida]
MSGFLAALRIARRDALRARGRTALVLAMIGLPVAAVVALAVLSATGTWSPREALPYEIGAADARLTGTGHAPVRQDPESDEPFHGSSEPEPGAGAERPWTTAEITRRVVARYGPRARVQPIETGGRAALETGRGVLAVRHTGLDLRDPMTRGILEVTRGRAPAAPDEIAVAPSLAGRFPLGATVRAGRDGAAVREGRDGVRLRVVGFARDPRSPRDDVVVTLPGGIPGPADSLPQWLISVGAPVTWDDVTDLNQEGITVLSRSVVDDPPRRDPAAAADSGPAAEERTIMAAAVAMIVLEVVLLAGPAFAVGIRRQRRDLALLAAAGGDAGHLRTVVLTGGLVLGAAAALAGALLGLLAAIAAKPVIRATTGHVLGPLDVPWPLVLTTMALGAGSAVAAASVPAVQAARMDVVAALGGRREAARSRRGWPLAGGALAGTGVVLCLAGTRGLREFGPALGAVAIIIGGVFAAPWLVGAAGRAARWLPLPLRLAVRDGARNRGRAAPVVAAIMAATAAVTALAVGASSDFRQERLEYEARLPMGSAVIRPPLERADAVAAGARREMPGVPVLELKALPGEFSVCGHEDTARCPSVSFGGGSTAGPGVATGDENVADIVVGGAREARLLLGRDDPEVSRALAAGRVVLFGRQPRPYGTTTATVAVWKDDQRHVLRAVPDLPAVAVAADAHVRAIVPPSAAKRIGVAPRIEALGVDRADHRVTPDEEARLKELLAGYSGDDGSVHVERGFTGSASAVLLLLAAAGAVLALGGTLIATGLSAADARPDLATLAAVGARPRTRRLLMAGQAGFVAVLGCWLGLAGGLVPGIAVARPLTAVEEIPAQPGADGAVAAPGHGPTIDIPWQLLLLIGVAVPLLAMLAAGLSTRSRLPVTRRPA